MGDARARARPIWIAIDDDRLSGDLTSPAGARAFVLVAHPSGSGRFSPHNRSLARVLNRAGMGTLLFDLFTPAEESTAIEARAIGRDVRALARRLDAAVDWIGSNGAAGDLPLGLFCSGTAAAAAIVCAASRPERVRALVSKGGRTQMAGPALARIAIPALFVVGAEDAELRSLNAQALRAMTAPAQLVLIEGASHVFDEPGALDRVAALAAAFFRRHLGAGAAHPSDPFAEISRP